MRLIKVIDSGLARVHGIVLEAYCRITGKPGNSLAWYTGLVVFGTSCATALAGIGELFSELASHKSGVMGSSLSWLSLFTAFVCYKLMTCLSNSKLAEGAKTIGVGNLQPVWRVALELASCLFLLWAVTHRGYLEAVRPLAEGLLLSGTCAVSYFLDEPSGGHPFRKALEWIKQHGVRQPHPMPT